MNKKKELIGNLKLLMPESNSKNYTRQFNVY
jgi:hypothetical protein